MKRKLSKTITCQLVSKHLIMLLIALTFVSEFVSAQFTQGNLVVLQVGTGAAALSSSSTAVFLKEYTTAGASVSSVTIPTTGVGNRLTMSGSSATEGMLSRSADLTKIVIAGYDTAPGVASISGSSAVNINRVIGVVDASGIYSRPVSSASYITGSSPRGATLSGSNYWALGGVTGVCYFGTGSPAIVSSTVTNNRAISIQNGQLYFSTGSGTTRGVYAVGTGTPTITGQTSVSVVNAGATASPEQFVFNAAGTICYIADVNTIATGGGVQKWTFNGSAWSLAYTLNTGITVGTIGLSVDFNGANPIVYATTAETTLNKIVKLTDTGAGSTFSVIATAATNTAFRGLSFAPFSCTSPTLSTSVTNTCPGTSNGEVNLTVSGGVSPYTYSWSNSATTQNLTSLATGNYTVTVLTNDGCTATISSNVGNLAAPSVSITGNTAFCPGGNSVLDAGSHSTYLWSDNSTLQTLNVSSAGTYTVTVSDGGDCTASANVAVTIHTPPSPTITGNTLICGSGSTTLNAGSYASYLWSTTETTQTIGVNLTGTYTVTVTDNNSCTASTSVSVSVSSALNPTITGNLQFCTGGSVSIGTQTFNSYLWSNSETTQSITTNVAGTYTVTVFDGGGCSGSASVLVIENSLPTVSVTGNTNICFGANTTLDAGVHNSYLWNNGTTTQTNIVNVAGTYSVTVTNIEGCSASASITISSSAQINISFTVTNQTSCPGNAASIEASGANTYAWAPATGLSATTGNSVTASPSSTTIYTVTGDDGTGCTATSTVAINILPAPTIAGTITPVSCTGIANGSIHLNVSGGTPCGANARGLLISKIMANPGGSDFALEYVELIAAKFIDFSITPYTVIVANNGAGTVNGWKAGGGLTYAFQITSGTASPGTVYYVGGKDMFPSINQLRVINITTTGGDGGLGNSQASAGVFGNGGANADAVGVFQGLVSTITPSSVPDDAVFYGTGIGTALVSAGTAGYQLPVNDFYAGGKLQSSSYFGPDALSDSILVMNGTYSTATNTFTTPRTLVRMPVSTFVQGVSNVALSGTAPYSFAWSNGETSQNLSNIINGTYTVTVTDCNGCSSSTSFTVGSNQTLTVSGAATNVNCNGDATGTATVNASVGTSPYNYLWSNGSTEQTALNLVAGIYTVLVTDVNGCSNTLSKTITQPLTSISLSATSVDELCAGDAMGSIDLSVTGGTPCGEKIPALVISKIFSNPSGNDSPFEFTELLATKDIDFSVTPYTVVFANNGSGNVAGWRAGGAVTYAFEINTGTAVAGTVYAVGGEYMTPFINRLRTIQTDITGGDGGIGTAALGGILGNGGTSADAVGVFKCTTAALDSTTVPVDAVFFGASMGGAVVSNGTQGYQLPVCDIYNGGKLQSNSFLAPDILSNQIIVANGTFNVSASGFLAPRTFTLDDIAFFIEGETNIVFTNAAPYTYNWSNGGTDQDVSSLVAGSYTVVVTDCNGCTASISVTITEPPAINATAVTFDVVCNGGNNGLIDLTAGGGTGTLSYLWSNGSTDEDQNNLIAGFYTVSITDANNCILIETYEITEPEGITLNAVVSNVTCKFSATGSIDLTATSPSTPLSFLWNNGNTNEDRSNLIAGVYTVIVMDANGCSTSASYTVTQPLASLVISTNRTNIRCGNKANGSATAVPAGGVAPFSYYWNNGNTTATIGGLSAGVYTVTVTDAAGCSKTKTVAITSNPALTVLIIPSGSTATASPSGGVAPYSYLWNTAPMQTNATATGLVAGNTYKVRVTDSKNCTLIASVTMPQPKLGNGLNASTTMVSVYPNPNNGFFIIQFSNSDVERAQVKITNSIGQLVYNKNIQPENNVSNIDLSTLPNGIYVLNVETENGRNTLKLIIE